MKAMKEKRVSLRSLFRRGLVILSLFALVFASCGDSGSGSGDDYEKGYQDGLAAGGGSATGEPVVVSMVVQKHPILPSYEGAMPELKGLEVMVIYDKDRLPEVIKDPTQFAVSPPVAKVTSATVNNTLVSSRGTYTIQYTGGISVATPVNVYVPAVIALQTYAVQGYDDNGTSALPRVTGGPIAEVYEDLGIDVSGLAFRARYMAFDGPAIATNAAFLASIAPAVSPGLGYVAADYSPASGAIWPQVEGGKIVSNSISSDPQALVLRTNRGGAGYFYKLGNAAGTAYPSEADEAIAANSNPLRSTITITNFYRVAQFEFVGVDTPIPPVAADYEDIVTGPTATKVPELDWVKILDDAGAKFKVIYYIPDTATATPPSVKDRVITMKDYVRAMYTVDPIGRPRATKPVITGVVPSSAPGSTLVTILNSVVYDFPLAVSLVYYDPLITLGGPGTGALDSTASPASTTINQAGIPLDDIIYTYSRMYAERRETTGITNDAVKVRYSNGVTVGNRLTQLHNALQMYWNVWYEYTGPAGSTPIRIKVPTGTVNAAAITDGATAPKQSLPTNQVWPAAFTSPSAALTASGYDDTPPDDMEEPRDITYRFPEPRSARTVAQFNANTVTYDDIDFAYIAQR